VPFIGLDFGEKTIGVAVSADGRIATGISTLRRASPEALRANLRELKEIIRAYSVTAIVLGYPKNMNNTPSERCGATLAFKEKLERSFKRVPVTLWDERLSTQAVSRAFEGSRSQYDARVDEMAAVYILQGFLDWQNKNMEEQMENDEKNITLFNDDGEETQFEILAVQKDGGDVYWLLAEITEDEDEADVFHYKCILSDDDEMTFELIDEEHADFEKTLELFKGDYEELGIIID
jgi:putative Holliday junction resolvase